MITVQYEYFSGRDEVDTFDYDIDSSDIKAYAEENLSKRQVLDYAKQIYSGLSKEDKRDIANAWQVYSEADFVQLMNEDYSLVLDFVLEAFEEDPRDDMFIELYKGVKEDNEDAAFEQLRDYQEYQRDRYRYNYRSIFDFSGY